MRGAVGLGDPLRDREGPPSRTHVVLDPAACSPHPQPYSLEAPTTEAPFGRWRGGALLRANIVQISRTLVLIHGSP